MPAGRPTFEITDSLVDALEEWIAEGKTLREFCRQDGNPSYATIYKAINVNTAIKERIACARESGEDAIGDECIEIADTEPDAQRAKVRIWTRLELLKKWNPRKWGDKVGLTGGDGGAIQHEIRGMKEIRAELYAPGTPKT